MRGFLTLLAVIAVLFFGGRWLADRYAHGDTWRTADGTTECRTKLGGTIQFRPVVQPGTPEPDWARAEEVVKNACENTKPD